MKKGSKTDIHSSPGWMKIGCWQCLSPKIVTNDLKREAASKKGICYLYDTIHATVILSYTAILGLA